MFMSDAPVTPAVYAAIGKVMAILAKAGIQKDRKNEQQGYKFRGIDDVYNALSPAMVEAGLIVLPSFSERACEERTTAKGSVLFYVTLIASFALVCVEDGSQVVAGPFYGEAMDSGDKATNKAMSAAYKYWAMQTFAIPTDADNDADATTHTDVAPKTKPQGTMPTAVFGAHKVAIGTAPDDIVLKRLFTKAYVEAQALGDHDAMNRFVDLKDARKQELLDLKSLNADIPQ